MARRTERWIICRLAALLWMAGFAGLTADPAWTQETSLPPFSRAYEPRTVDERGIWMMADEDERDLRDSPFSINDPELIAYIRSVLCRTVGEDRCSAVRIYVRRIATFQASMRPNGAMEVWSGLLLRTRDEAELAAVLGHEFAHFELRHSLSGYRQRRRAYDVAAWASLLGPSGYAVQNSAIGSIYAYSRSQEQEADFLSLKYLQASSYNPHCFADIWARLMEEADATALGRGRRSARYNRVAFFSTHPTTVQRVAYLRSLAGELGGDEGEQRYQDTMRGWQAGFLEDQIKLNNFGGTEYLLGQLAHSGWTPPLIYARGEMYRLRGNPRDFFTAAEFYREVIAWNPDFAEAYRGLGLALLRTESAAQGKDALRRYLTLRPDAPDAPLIFSFTQ